MKFDKIVKRVAEFLSPIHTIKLLYETFVLDFLEAEDIYTAAGWEFMYQNGYVHGSPSRFSAKSAIYTAAGCQHIIAIYTAAVPEQFQTKYTAAVCLRKIAIYTAANQEQNWQRINTRLPGGSSCIKMVMYTAALQDSQPNRLYTRLPGVNI